METMFSWTVTLEDTFGKMGLHDVVVLASDIDQARRRAGQTLVATDTIIGIRRKDAITAPVAV